MSAGAFSRSRYAADSGEIHPIRVQPETLALTLGGTANAAPAGAVTSSISAKVSGGRRNLGLKARMVSLAFTGAVPDGYEPDSVTRVPILTPALFTAIGRGTTGTYLGVGVEVLGKSSESSR